MKPSAIVISFFNSDNLGDLLLSQNIKNIIEEKYSVTLIDFTTLKEVSINLNETTNHNKVKSNRGLKKKIFKYFPFIKDIVAFSRVINKKKYQEYKRLIKHSSDIYIAGGNMMMDLNFFPIYTFKILKLVSIARKNKKKVNVIFMGVGPFQNKMQIRIVKKIIDKVDFISVRDNNSYNILKSINGHKEISIWRDPVFLNECVISNKINKKNIGVNVYVGTNTNDFSMILESFIWIINRISVLFPKYSIILFSTEKMDYDNIHIVYNRLSDKSNILIKHINTYEDLISLYNKCDLVIGTRMHTIITALTQRIPVISIGWQAKVESLINQLEMMDFYFSINELKKDKKNIIEKVQFCLDNQELLKQQINYKISNIVAEIEDNISKHLK